MSSGGGNLSLTDYIAAVQNAEKAYGKLSVYEMVSSVRQLYYANSGFQLLLPDSIGAEIKYAFYPFPVLLDRKNISLLRKRADENGSEDNPSPYLAMPGTSNETIDIGHQLLTIDALRFPRAEDPFLSYKIPNIDLASWVADLAIAAYWNEILTLKGKLGLIDDAQFITLTGARDEDALRKKINLATSLSIDDFFAWSAPESDLLGDVDGFGLYQLQTLNSNFSFSQLLDKYYSAEPPFINRRFFYFCYANDMNYDYSTQDWLDIAFLQGTWLPRIDRCIDLFLSSKWSLFETVYVASIPPAPKSYPSSARVLKKFLDWLKDKLQNELRRSNGRSQPTSGPLFPKR